MIRIASILLALCISTAVLAQQVPPYTYPLTIGTSSVSILPASNARKKLLFHNPNDSAKIAVCPVGPTRAVGGSPALIVAAINGPAALRFFRTIGFWSTTPQQDPTRRYRWAAHGSRWRKHLPEMAQVEPLAAARTLK